MAILTINDQWRIVGTDYSWEVQKYAGTRARKDKQGARGPAEPVWAAMSFHPTLGKACAALAARRLRTADVEGIEAIEAEARRICEELDAKLAMVPAGTGQKM